MSKIKDKERLLKAAREKQQVMYKGTPIRLSIDFSAETLQARREWHYIFKVMKSKSLQPRIFYPAYNQEYSTFIKIWRRDQKFYKQAKAKRAQHHKTSFL